MPGFEYSLTIWRFSGTGTPSTAESFIIDEGWAVEPILAAHVLSEADSKGLVSWVGRLQLLRGCSWV